MSTSTPLCRHRPRLCRAGAGRLCQYRRHERHIRDTAAKPKTVLIADFVASPEVDATDRGFSTRMDRNGSKFPILERKRRTLARVNDEIVAAIVVTLREAGLDAQPGSEEALTLHDQAAVVSGRL